MLASLGGSLSSLYCVVLGLLQLSTRNVVAKVDCFCYSGHGIQQESRQINLRLVIGC